MEPFEAEPQTRLAFDLARRDHLKLADRRQRLLGNNKSSVLSLTALWVKNITQRLRVSGGMTRTVTQTLANIERVARCGSVGLMREPPAVFAGGVMAALTPRCVPRKDGRSRGRMLCDVAASTTTAAKTRWACSGAVGMWNFNLTPFRAECSDNVPQSPSLSLRRRRRSGVFSCPRVSCTSYRMNVLCLPFVL